MPFQGDTPHPWGAYRRKGGPAHKSKILAKWKGGAPLVSAPGEIQRVRLHGAALQVPPLAQQRQPLVPVGLGLSREGTGTGCAGV